MTDLDAIKARACEAVWRYNAATDDIKQLVSDRHDLLEMLETANRRIDDIEDDCINGVGALDLVVGERQRCVEALQGLAKQSPPGPRFRAIIDCINAIQEETT